MPFLGACLFYIEAQFVLVKQTAARARRIANFNFEETSAAGARFLLLIGGQPNMVNFEA